VLADQRPLEQIITLAVAIEPRLLRAPFLQHEVLKAPDVLATAVPGFSNVERDCADSSRIHSVFICCRHLARHAGAASSVYNAAGANPRTQRPA